MKSLLSWLFPRPTGTGIPGDRLSALRVRRRLARLRLDGLMRKMAQANMAGAYDLREQVMGALDVLVAIQVITDHEATMVRREVGALYESQRGSRMLAESKAMRERTDAQRAAAQVDAVEVSEGQEEDFGKFFFESVVSDKSKRSFAATQQL